MSTSTVLESFDGSYQQKLGAATKSLMPAGMTSSTHYIGKPILIDPSLNGTFRFSRGIGNAVGLIVSDVTARLTSAVQASSTTVEVTHVPKWITEGSWITINRGDLLRVASVDPYRKTITFLYPERPTSYAALSLLRLHSVPCSQVGDVVASRVYLLPADNRITFLSGDIVEQQIDLNLPLSRRRFRVLDASLLPSGYYSVDLAVEPDVDLGDGGSWSLVARPAYVSNELRIPEQAHRFSPLVFDAPSNILNAGDVSDPRFSTYCKVTVYSLDSAGATLAVGETTNSIVETKVWPSTFLLFGQVSSGTMDFNKVSKRVVLQPESDWVMVSLPVLSILRKAEGFKFSALAGSAGTLQVIVDEQTEVFALPAGESEVSVVFGFYPGGFGSGNLDDQREPVLPPSVLKIVWTPDVAESTLGVSYFESLGSRSVETLTYSVLMPEHQPESLCVGPAVVKPLMPNLEILTASEGDTTDSGFIIL